jgi:hypothetical protein
MEQRLLQLARRDQGCGLQGVRWPLSFLLRAPFSALNYLPPLLLRSGPHHGPGERVGIHRLAS